MYSYTFNKEKDMWFLRKEFENYFWIDDIDSTYQESSKLFELTDRLLINNHKLFGL